jgi:hypothetical protein
MKWIAVRIIHLVLALLVGVVAGPTRGFAQSVSPDRPDDVAAPAAQEPPRWPASEPRWTVALGVGFGLFEDSGGFAPSALVERRRPGRLGVGLAVTRENNYNQQRVRVAPLVTKELGEFARIAVGPVAGVTTVAPGYGHSAAVRRMSAGVLAVAIGETSASRRAYLGLTGVVGWIRNGSVRYEWDFVGRDVVSFPRFANRRVVTIGAHMGVRF